MTKVKSKLSEGGHDCITLDGKSLESVYSEKGINK